MRNQAEVYDLCRYFVESFTGSLKDALLGHIRARDLKSLCSVSKLYVQHCHTAHEFGQLLQVEAFFKKNEIFSDPHKCGAAAASAFLSAEEKCRVTNARLDTFYDERENDFVSEVERAQDFILNVLGDFDQFRDSIPDLVRLTNGATSTAPRKRSLMHYKVQREYRCPSRATPYIKALASYFSMPVPRVRSSCFNRVVFVPKNWKTFRTIACEPDGALPLQLAFDAYAKKRLRRFGIDLLDQSRNQELALRGSIDNSMATIDLEQASDTVAYATVELLFPAPWFRYLESLRSTYYKGTKTAQGNLLGTGKYHKFSSMGNGSTFAVETLIFAACCYAVGARDYSVYGDDICITTPHVARLIELLAYLGFSVNPEKSFSSGPYRESCGHHYWSGSLITPHFVRGDVTRKAHLAHNVNGLAPLALGAPLLAAALKRIVKDESILLVPFNDLTTSGCFITRRSSMETGRLRFHPASGTAYFPYASHFKAHTVSTPNLRCWDSRTLFLWHFAARKARQVLTPGVFGYVERSRYASSSLKYKTARVYLSRKYDEPDHLPWWSDYILRES